MSQRRPTPRNTQRRSVQGAQRKSVRDMQRRQGVNPLAAAIVVAAAGVLIIGFMVLRSCQGAAEDTADKAEPVDTRPRATLVAVGDNAPNENIAAYAEAAAQKSGNGRYDYTPIYAPVANRIQAADLAYLNQETCVGGDEIGPKGYPSFNATDEAATAVVDAGFDFVGLANNHIYDWGPYGTLRHSVDLWESLPVAFTGASNTEEQYDRIVTREANGITFALLDYTYGVNGYDESSLPHHSVNFIDEQRIASDVQRAREQADVVLVAMHWGVENDVEPSEEQRAQAQMLANLDVDVVLGAHPHVIQPMEWVENADGSGHRTLVTYSLGNFLFDHEYPLDDNVLEGMLSCDFVREDDGSISIENIEWIPLVCHSSEARDDFAIYEVNDYPYELAAKNRGLSELPNAREWLFSRTREVVGEQWFK